MKQLYIAFIFVCLLITCSALGQSRNPSADSYHRGLKIVESSFNAMGGEPAFSKIDDLSFSLRGVFFARNQSLKSDTPFDKLPIENKIVFDLKNDRLSWNQRNYLPGGLLFDNRIVIGGKDPSFALDLQRIIHTRVPAGLPAYDLATTFVPIKLLKKILQQKSDIRWVGETTIDGRKHNMVDVIWSNASYTLYFDEQTDLLTKQENIAPDAAVGDDWLETYTAAYQKFDGVLLPTKCRQWQSGKLVLDTDYVDYKINQKLDDTLFKLPAEYPLFQRPTFAVKPISKNVYLAEGLVGGGYRSLIVALDEGVLVVDSPGVSQLSARVIGEIKKLFPDKPIKYLVETHYHDDHTGGIRPYIAEGAKIVTTKRNQKFFEDMAAAQHTLMPDVLSTKPQKPDFLFVEKKQTFGDGELSVEVVNLGSPHAEDMYLIYLPNERIVFQSDLYNWADKAVTDSTVDMVNKIEKLGWQVETVIGSHSGAGPYQQIKDEVRVARERK